MASVNSVSRRILKPLIKKVLGARGYEWFHQRAKIRDIHLQLVEEPEMATLSWFVKPGDLVLDIGANFGYYTSRLSALCRDGKVIAFEPVPSTYFSLSGIVKKLRLPNVDLYKVGVGEKSGPVEFEIPLQQVGTPSAGQAHFAGRDNTILGSDSHYAFKRSVKVSCDVVALDAPEWRSRISGTTFVKMDIEGAEYFALKGMKGFLAEAKPVILMEICPYFLAGFGIEPIQLRNLIKELGYETFSYIPAIDKLLPLGREEYQDGNYLLIHSSKLNRFAAQITKVGE